LIRDCFVELGCSACEANAFRPFARKRLVLCQPRDEGVGVFVQPRARRVVRGQPATKLGGLGGRLLNGARPRQRERDDEARVEIVRIIVEDAVRQVVRDQHVTA